MDENEGGILPRIPPGAMNLTLSRSTIKMQHSATWRIDKTNKTHDFVVALEGEGTYTVGDHEFTLSEGEGMIIPANARFVGSNQGTVPFLRLAQHFELKVFGDHDLISLINLRPKARLRPWEMIRPLAWHYRKTSPSGSVTMPQHHAFMVMFNAFIESAFVEWKPTSVYKMDSAAAIDLAVMQAASTISTRSLTPDATEQAIKAAPYNKDYFQREFQKRIGRTPKKYHEFCRMERAMKFLEAGFTVAAVANEVGYSDPYYFSRMFKRTIGVSPRDYIRCVALGVDAGPFREIRQAKTD